MIRWIFEGNTTYTEFEQNALKEFETTLEKKFIKLPDECILFILILMYRWLQNKWNSLKFLHANKWDHDKAIKTIQEYLDWKKNNTPVTLTNEISSFLVSDVCIHWINFRTLE